MEISDLYENRIDDLISDLEEWMTLVADEEDWLVDGEDDVIEIFGSKEDYLVELIGWVSEHVCSEDKHNPEWWMSHGFTEEEAAELSGVEKEME